jgi:hypothetical protein
MNPLRPLAVAAVSFLSFSFAIEPTSPTTEESVFTIDKLISLVPADAKLKYGSKWETVGVAIATQSLKKNALGKQAEFTVKIALQEPHPYNGHAICIHSKPASVKVNDVSLPSVVYAYFDADNLKGLGAVRAGDTVTISGILNQAEFQVGRDPRLFLELIRARLNEPKAK